MPSLVLDDGGPPLFQSMAIMEWLEETKPQPPLLPKDPRGRARVRGLALIAAADGASAGGAAHPRLPGKGAEARRADEKQVADALDASRRSRRSRCTSKEKETGRFCHGDSPDHRRHLPRRAGDRRHRLFQVRRLPRADGDAHLRGVHEDRRIQQGAPAEAAGRVHPLGGGRTMAFNRRTFRTGCRSGSSSRWLFRDRFSQSQADPARADDGEDRPARLGRHRHGARADPVPEGAQLHARRPQGRAVRRRQRAACRRRRAPRSRSWSSATRIHIMIGPLAAAEALAADDYIRQAQLLTLSVAAAEDLTQRRPNPWFMRGTVDLVAVRAPDGRLRVQGAEDAAHGDHRRRLRLRPRDVRRLPARVRGAGRQDRAEDVPAAHGARLRHLPRAAQDQRRRHLPRLRRLQRLPLPAPVQRVRPARQGHAGRRHDRARRGGAAQHGRRGARHRHLLLVLGRDREPDQPEASPPPSARSGSTTPASTPPPPTPRRRCSRRRSSRSRARSRTRRRS